MPRYIDADALMKDFACFVSRSNNSDFEKEPTWNDAISIVENAPTVNVRKNVHAHWEDWSFLGWDMETHWRRRCSNCLCEREDDNEEKDTLFCPNCGARMDERKEDEH